MSISESDYTIPELQSIYYGYSWDDEPKDYSEAFFRMLLPSSRHLLRDLLPPDTRTRQQYLADQKKWAKRDRRLKWQRRLRRLNPFQYRIQHVDDMCNGEDCGIGYE